MQRYVSRISNINNSTKRQREFSQDSQRKKTTSTVTAKKTPVQTYLDVGQKSLGKSTRCGTCDMVFVPDDEEDLAAHVKFCQQVRNYRHIVQYPSLRILITTEICHF